MCKRCLLVCRHIQIIADGYVDREFGTGALKITPAHDPNDYEIGKKHDLEMINIMNNDGSLNANAGKYTNMDRADARSQLWRDMEVGLSPSCILLITCMTSSTAKLFFVLRPPKTLRSSTLGSSVPLHDVIEHCMQIAFHFMFDSAPLTDVVPSLEWSNVCKH